MGTLDWAEISTRFDAAQSWWVATGGPAGPHSVPVWGVVVGGVLRFYGEESTVRSRNLAADPRLVLHLESASDVLVVHGTAGVSGFAHEHADVCSAYAAKYSDPTDREYLPDAPGMAAARLYVVTPTRAIAWRLDSSEEWDNRRWHAAPV